MELEWAWPWTWKMVLITIVLLSSKDLHGRTSGCWEEERAALLQLKASINHPNGHFLPSWKEDDKESNCCAWERIACGFDGRVSSLELYNVRRIQDWHLNASVFLPLHELRELSLSGNKLVSWMEDKGCESLSSKLKNLEVLDLSVNVLDERVLSTLGTLSSLGKLDLSYNSIKGSTLHLRELLEPFRNLEELHLAGNSLSNITTINASEMHSLSFKTLKLLDLSSNYLQKNVLSQLSGLSSLKYLSLSFNSLEGSIYVQDIEALEDLEELDLSDNKIHSFITTNGSEIPSRLKNLKVLNLGGNKFTTSNLSSLQAFSSLRQLSLNNNYDLIGSINLHDIKVMQNLEELVLCRTSIQGFIGINKSHELSHMEILYMDGCVNLGQNSTLQGLGMMTSLRVLTLKAAMLNGELTTYGWLCQLRNLQVLDLSANGFSGTLPQCLKNITALRVLNLRKNKLLGNIVISPLTNLTLLEELSLSDNFFQLPQSLSSFVNHSNLKVLTADNNKIIPNSKIQSSVPKFQLQVLSLSNCTLGPSPPNFLYHQRDLTIIDLSHNFLQGDFPYWLIKNNTRLQGLYLQDNLLTGPFRLPFQPHPLSAISIAHNKMSGSIPTNMCLILYNLEWLDMSSNHFKGNVPPCFRDMKSLKILILSNNQFSGRLFELFMADSSLMVLDVSLNVLDGPITSISNLLDANMLFLQGNNFSGTISPMLYLMKLEILDISNNSLSGELPRFTKINLPRLNQLDMSKNQLEGSIPNQYCELSLEVFDISDNNLSGSVPSCFPSSIIYLQLSNNKLSGSMTHPISVSINLQLLDLSHNNLSGSIPKWIHSLETLRILILGSNQFEGKIPTKLCKLSQLSILDLSKNDLSGPIPSCLNNITFQPTGVKRGFELALGFRTDVFQYNSKGSIQYNPIDTFFTFTEEVKFTTKSTTYSYEGNMLGYMTGIDLSCNALSGEIPPEIGSFSEIQALNLSHNKFTGSIPKTFSNLSQIESLDLSHNSLNGSIPSQLIELNSLAVFSVAHNNLSGKTPDFTRQFATFEESSYEGNPFLCGPPLSKSCYEAGSPSSSMPNFKEEEEDDDLGWIDMSIFHTSFGASYGTFFLAVIAILLINSHWRRTWFYYVDAFIIYSYYFIVDSLRKLGKSGR